MTDVESLSASLVREYLSRKGLKRSLRILDEEFPRTEESIRNRVVLAKEVKIEKIMRINKELGSPLRTMIEVMVKYFINDRASRKSQKTTSDENSRRSTLTKSLSISDIREGKLSHREKDLDHELEQALRITSEDSNKAKSHQIGKYGSHFEVSRESNSSPRFGEASKTQLEATDKCRIRGKDATLAKSSKSSLVPVVDRRSKAKTEGHIQRTVDTTRKISKKKNIDFMANGYLGMEIETEASTAHAVLEREKDIYTDSLQTKQMNNDRTQIGRRKSKENDLLEQRRHPEKRSQNSSFKTKQPSDIMVFDDVDDEFSDGDGNINFEIPASRPITKLHDVCQPITLEIATNLKTIIFGSSTTCFNYEWKNQSFSFCDLPDLEYGIVQIKGGPCGVLAAVQATVLKNLLFEKEIERKTKRPLAPSSKERTMALASSLSEIFWRAGSRKSACVVMPAVKAKFMGGGRYKSDGLTETLSIYSFKESESLKTFVSQNIGQFESETSSGCILFMYSLILSRSIRRIQGDMDEANGTLIGAHGYCTQELVNLCLTGKSVSNVFDGTIELDSGGSSKSILKGIDKQSDIGLLSLFEHYGSCKVGDNYKCPKYPIWVVCSESHFSTLFSTNHRLLHDRVSQRRFDLYYYDGLARQDEEIKLTIDQENEFDSHDNDLIPPLEHCIRTKWKNVTVDWNNTEPIL